MVTTQRTDKRTHILNVAGKLFLEKGFAGTSMGDIAKAGAGSKGTLYTYFDSKEQLFEEYMRLEICSRSTPVFDLPEEIDDPVSVLHDFGVRYLKLTTDPIVVEILRTVVAEAVRFPEISELFHEEGPHAGHVKLKAFLKRCTEQRHLVIDDIELAASQFNRLCQAQIMLDFLFGVRKAPTDEEIDHIVTEAVRVFMAAYGSAAEK
ncbi:MULTISPECIES: TetR/AcrR family transcriptional regulator [Sphingomonadales]|nr:MULTISPECIES: TetR/AcrR family transcriptional regulator [Sphingomonadaceae]WOF45904.1 TetR/AcrR family transcriptional regulator [Sphingopyxis indica]